MQFVVLREARKLIYLLVNWSMPTTENRKKKENFPLNVLKMLPADSNYVE